MTGTGESEWTERGPRNANMFEVNKVFYYTRCDTNCQSSFFVLFMSENKRVEVFIYIYIYITSLGSGEGSE